MNYYVERLYALTQSALCVIEDVACDFEVQFIIDEAYEKYPVFKEMSQLAGGVWKVGELGLTFEPFN